MKLRKIPKTAKRTFTGLMAVVLAATAVGPLSVLVSANYKSLQYIEEIKEDKTSSGSDFGIFEIVPDASETTMGYYVNNSDPINKFINAAIDQNLDSAGRQTAINNIYNGKLSDVIGTTDAYPMTKTASGYVEYTPWSDNIPEGLSIITANAEEKFTNVPDKFRTAKDDEEAEYQSHGVYVLPTEYFDLSTWISNSYTRKEMTSGLNITTDGKSYVTFENDTTTIKLTSPHTGYALTSAGFSNYYSMKVTPGTTYTFSFDFDSSNSENNGTDGQLTLYTYGSTGTPVSKSASWTRVYTDKSGNKTTVNGNTTLKKYIFSAPENITTGANGLWDNNQGHYDYTFTVPDGVYYIQASFGTWSPALNNGNTGSVTFSDIHFRETSQVPDVVQEISVLEPATAVENNTADDYYYAVNYTPISSIDDFTDDAIIYEQVWSDENKPLYYVLNADGTVSSELVTEDEETDGEKVPVYQLLFDTGDLEDDIEYSETKLKAGGYGKLSINESASVVVTENPDAEHFYHAVPVYNNAGDLSFIKPSADTTGYYSGNNSYFVTESVNYSYVGSGGDYVYDKSTSTTKTATVYTQKFYYDKGITCNEWFKYKVLDRFDGDNYDFLTTVDSYSPADISDNESQFLLTLKTKDMIVISGGTQVNFTAFASDISSEIRESILTLAGSDYNIPIVVDLNVLNMISSDAQPQLYKLVNALIDRSTESEINVKGGGVSGNIYVFKSSDIGSSSIATSKFNAPISKDLKADNSSPYYDVYSEIEDENVYRGLDSYTYESTPLPQVVSIATCMRSIINYAGRRVKNVKKEVRVLDIEPYVSVDHRTAVITDKVYAYASKKYSETECLKATDVISWLPDGTFSIDGRPAKAAEFTEEQAAKYIKITTMSVAEFVGHNEDLIGNYDLIYFGDSLENFNDDNKVVNGVKHTKYNDSDMDGLIYTGMGDTYVIGNNANVIDGDTLLGLNTEDYTRSVELFGKTLRYMVSGEVSTVRATGNDITDTAEKKLDAFAKAGLPVVIASGLTNTAEGTGIDGGVYNDEGNLEISYSVTVETKTQFREYDSRYKNKYFTYFLATFNGTLPAGVGVKFTWYAVPNDKFNSGNFSKENSIKITEVTAKTGFLGRVQKSEEPVHAYSVKNDDENNVYNWYSTIGDIDQNFDYYDWNDDITENKITGMTIPESRNYQALNTYYFCEATLVVEDKYKDDPILSLYNNTNWRSNIVQAVKRNDQNLTVKVESSYGGNTTITVTPNPYYVDGISDNFSFWWKYKQTTTHKWRIYEDDPEHRIDHEDLWNANQTKTVMNIGSDDKINSTSKNITKVPVSVNKTNSNGVKIATIRQDGSDTFTLTGYDESDKKDVQKFESSGSWENKKDSDGNLLKDKNGFYIRNNAGYLKMTNMCVHSTNDDVLSCVEFRIKAISSIVKSNSESGITINLTNNNQMGDDYNYGQTKNLSKYPNLDEDDDAEKAKVNGVGTWEMPYETLTMKDSGVEVKNTPIVITDQLAYINTLAVDNTTKIYKFLSSVYDTVTENDEGTTYVTRSDGAVLKKNGNVFNEVQFAHAKDTSEIKKQMYQYLYTVYSPELRMINNSVVSYPKTISDNTISGEFIIYNDIDTNGTDSYIAELYIDQDHDAKFSDEEKIGFTSLTEFGKNANKTNLMSSTTDGKQLHEYKFTKQLTDGYMGLVSWKLEIVRVGNSSISDSYTGYSYIQTSEKKTINAVQVLPADWWSAGTDGKTQSEYVSTYGQWNRNTKKGYKDSEYTGSKEVGYVGKDSELKDAYEKERANEITGNAYLGSVFLGDGGKTKIVEKTDDGQYKVVYADAFYSLITASDSILDRTVYYESTESNDYDYRTHVVFWVRPQGEKTPRKDENGQIELDKKGNVIYEYKKCDFEVDIALTDIYELNNLYKSSECKFLDSYDMLILGFGDSYGKCETQSSWLKFFGYDSKSKATLGFSVGAALAVKKFIEDDKPVLFCHDTTNTTNNYITYFAQNALSALTSGLNSLADKVETLWNKIKEWFTGIKPEDEKNFTVDIQTSKVKDGYYNNILLRDSLNLDRFGITYSIRQTIGENNISENMENNTWADGYKYNGIPYYQRETTSVKAMREKNFSIVYKSKAASTSKGKNGVEYVNYNEYGEPIADTFTRKFEENGTITYRTVSASDDDSGEKSKMDYDKSAQGFTTWSIVRYGDEGTKNQLLPAGIVSSNTDGHVIMTNKVQQVNKGQITTYPYDINTAEFDGTTGNTDEYSNSYGKITIKATHEQVYQVNTNGDDTTVWYTLAGADEESADSDYRDDYDAISKDVVNSYYIFTSGNITYTGAGHSNIFSEEEAKLFLNTLVASYRLPGEKPDLDFVNDKGEQSSYILLTAEETEKKDSETGVVTKEFTVDDGIAAIRIDDPNVKREKITVNFFTKDEDGAYVDYNGIVLYESKDCSGTPVANDNVKSGVVYYFKVPDDIKKAIANNTAGDESGTESNGSYTLYAQAVTTVKTSGEATDYASGYKYIQFRRVGLYDLA